MLHIKETSLLCTAVFIAGYKLHDTGYRMPDARRRLPFFGKTDGGLQDSGFWGGDKGSVGTGVFQIFATL
jgi:hypothetical protein